MIKCNSRREIYYTPLSVPQTIFTLNLHPHITLHFNHISCKITCHQITTTNNSVTRVITSLTTLIGITSFAVSRFADS